MVGRRHRLVWRAGGRRVALRHRSLRRWRLAPAKRDRLLSVPRLFMICGEVVRVSPRYGGRANRGSCEGPDSARFDIQNAVVCCIAASLPDGGPKGALRVLAAERDSTMIDAVSPLLREMQASAATIPLIGIGTENSVTDPGLRFINDSLFM